MYRAKSLLESIFLWMLKNRFLSLGIFLGIIFLALYVGQMQVEKKMNTEFFTVERKNVEEIVSVTGTVKPTEEAELSFEKTGIVKTIEVKLGEKVEQGDVLATLSSDDENARFLEARANLSAANALLSDLQSGSKTETIDIKKSAVEKADTDILQSYKNAGDTIKNLSISGNTFVRDNFASYYTGNFTEGFRINISSCDSMTESKVNILRKESEVSLINIENFSKNYETLDSTQKENTILEIKNIHSPKISEYLNVLKDLFSLNCLTSNSNFDSARVTIASARNSWSSLNTDLSTKYNIIGNYKIAKSQAVNDLTLSQTGEKSDKINQQLAQVKAAEARMSEAMSNQKKNILYAPFTGIVTNIDLKKGELVSPGGKTISLISDANFQIESKVSEVDVAKLKVGATSSVSFDAYGDNIKFTAIISNISLAGIISEGVPTYKTILNFIEKDERIRSGMTANIDVITNIHPNTIYVPAKFILNENGEKYVNVVNGNDLSDFEKVKVKIGVKGISGEVEILEGLTEGQKVQLQKEI